LKSTVTILRAEIASDELVDVLTAALGTRCRVTRPDADTVLVQAGPGRPARAHVRIARGPDRTVLTVRPEGLVLGRLRGFGLARRVTRVLQQSAELRMPG
jgi:hypothetical protein